jgi:hypothetical protein
VLEYEGVHVLGRPHQLHAGKVLVHEEDGRLRWVAVYQRVHEEEVRNVPGGDVPLLAVDHVVVTLALRGRGDHGRIRPGPLLGDRIRVATFAAAGRPQIDVLLLLRGVAQGDRGPPGDVPQSVGGSAPLLLDQDLLEDPEAPAPVLDRMVHGIEPIFKNGLSDGPQNLLGETVLRLAPELMGDQVEVGELPGPTL